MEVTIRTHFAREHAKMKSLMVRQKIAVDAATLQFFKTDDGTVERAAATAARASLDLAADEETADGARTHVRRGCRGSWTIVLTACEGGKTKELKSFCSRRALELYAQRAAATFRTTLSAGLSTGQGGPSLIDAGADCAYRDETGPGPSSRRAGAGVIQE